MTDLVHDSKVIDWTYSANWTENLSTVAITRKNRDTVSQSWQKVVYLCFAELPIYRPYYCQSVFIDISNSTLQL